VADRKPEGNAWGGRTISADLTTSEWELIEMLREQKPDEIGLGPELRLRLIGANSKYWLRLAEETRSEAEQITDPRSKQMMLNVAETYNGMARRAEKKGRDPHQNAGIPAPAMCPPRKGLVASKTR
jgi:hypothetical protein